MSEESIKEASKEIQELLAEAKDNVKDFKKQARKSLNDSEMEHIRQLRRLGKVEAAQEKARDSLHRKYKNEIKQIQKMVGEQLHDFHDISNKIDKKLKRLDILAGKLHNDIENLQRWRDFVNTELFSGKFSTPSEHDEKITSR